MYLCTHSSRSSTKRGWAGSNTHPPTFIDARFRTIAFAAGPPTRGWSPLFLFFPVSISRPVGYTPLLDPYDAASHSTPGLPLAFLPTIIMPILVRVLKDNHPADRYLVDAQLPVSALVARGLGRPPCAWTHCCFDLPRGCNTPGCLLAHLPCCTKTDGPCHPSFLIFACEYFVQDVSTSTHRHPDPWLKLALIRLRLGLICSNLLLFSKPS